MKRTLLTPLLLALAVSANAEPTSRAACVLQWMPGVMNDRVAEAVVEHCNATLIGSKYNAKRREAGEDGIGNAFECFHRHAAATTSDDAAAAIDDACKALYPRRPFAW